ncbi:MULTISPECIES: YbaB/EbfC family nucleoid-associated protein [Glycomyces]|jgi:DNA-binding protein YbaB|uniref:YbaB/EbfC DNA-binding family protein n=1 Tax=Glycomyces artemisiae TaxID=1076443 RepID=A0A2T0USP5_9ACTN|nr:YbaB/EbfC family nucleoid-associated protein [Glycomyces artemisiae]NUQ88599.1 YbaB/EbfC family nucleoid-associated protein [Glycomyces artemisiae]PRY60867.1 YbaB/EbfC DNA-binding family protein [Glycomyces artemisiae]
MSDQRPTDPEAMMRRLEQMQAEAESMLAKFNELSERLGADAVEVFSEDGRIRVKLDAEGKVAEIGIDESSMRQHQSLSPTIMALIQEATATHAVKMAQMAQSLVGDKIDVMGIVNRDMPEHLRDRARDNLER